MKFSWTTLVVKDMAASLAFYEGFLGLEIQRRLPRDNGPEIVFLGKEDAMVELIAGNPVEATQPGAGISLGFTTGSLDAAIALAGEKGLPLHSGPFQPNPHIRFFFVLDPDGYKIQIAENM